MNWMDVVRANLFSECLELHIRSVLFVREIYIIIERHMNNEFHGLCVPRSHTVENGNMTSHSVHKWIHNPLC